MDLINLEVRLTHRYVGTFRHLDQWRDVGTAVLAPARTVQEPEDFNLHRVMSIMRMPTMDDRPSWLDYASAALVAAMMGYALACMI